MKRRLMKNTAASLLQEFVSLACAFILPRLIISNYGSEYNGIVSSVSNFLAFVTLLRGGVGGVTRAAMYKPLVEQDVRKLSGIVNATERFMRKVAFIFVVFLICFALVYPMAVEKQFDYFFTVSLVVILGISTVAQYYFGITYQFLLQADQRNYVYSLLQTSAVLINTVLSAWLINLGVEFRMMKLVSSIIFCITPFGLFAYVRSKYRLDRTVKADETALSQRWDAFAHQIAGYIHSNTDLVVLTIFGDLFMVSVYSIYYLVANGVKKLVIILTSGFEAALGNLLGKKELGKFTTGVFLYEWGINVISIIIFTCMSMLITPFVSIFMKDINDANYYQPTFGYLLAMSEYISCIRIPYFNVIEVSGLFKETKKYAAVEAMINIILSVSLVKRYGYIGVALGTIIATIYRTIHYAVFAANKVVKCSIIFFVKRQIISIGNIVLLMGSYFWLDINHYLDKCCTYMEWFAVAVITFCVASVITLAINIVCYPQVTKKIVVLLLRKEERGAEK